MLYALLAPAGIGEDLTVLRIFYSQILHGDSEAVTRCKDQVPYKSMGSLIPASWQRRRTVLTTIAKVLV